jgi:hypothetical protein
MPVAVEMRVLPGHTPAHHFLVDVERTHFQKCNGAPVLVDGQRVHFHYFVQHHLLQRIARGQAVGLGFLRVGRLAAHPSMFHFRRVDIGQTHLQRMAVFQYQDGIAVNHHNHPAAEFFRVRNQR